VTTHRRRWLPAGVVLVCLGVAAGIGVALSGEQPVAQGLLGGTVPASPVDRLMAAGSPTFWAGLNYPWKTGQDFGTGGWGHTGVSDSTTYQEIDADFANMASQGVRIVKWRVFSDGRYGLQFADDGTVTGLDNLFFPDLDAALEIARRHDMYLVLTLFSSGLWTADCQSGGVHLGGQASTLMDPLRRTALVDRAVVPMLEHIKASDRVLAYEVVAEPEWGIVELKQEQDARIKLPRDVLRDFMGEVVQAIHQHSRALATVESNRFSNMQNWRDLGLDYYSFSWYDWLEPYEPLATPAASANLDRPVVIGEYPAGGSAYYQVPQVLDTAYSLGYAGAFGWSYWDGDGISHWRDVAPGYTSWMTDHLEAVGLGSVARAPVPGTVAEQQYPYSYQALDLQLDAATVVADLQINVPSGEAYVPHAYLFAAGSTQPLEDVRLSAAPGRPGELQARFSQAVEGPAYTLSLGIFDPAGSLRKWFNSLATFAIQGGVLTTPQTDTLANELGCGA
jgi:hypothetical protein